jgi:hypothetical protein
MLGANGKVSRRNHLSFIIYHQSFVIYSPLNHAINDE